MLEPHGIPFVCLHGVRPQRDLHGVGTSPPYVVEIKDYTTHDGDDSRDHLPSGAVKGCGCVGVFDTDLEFG